MAGGTRIVINDKGISLITGVSLKLKLVNISLMMDSELKRNFLIYLSLMRLIIIQINGIFMIYFMNLIFQM